MRKGDNTLVDDILKQRELAPRYDPISEFGHASMSLNQSLLTRWPDVEAKQRQDQVRYWYEQLRERIEQDIARTFETDPSPRLRAVYITEALEAAVRHTILGKPMERSETEEFFEGKLRSRLAQILRVLFGIDPEIEDFINLDEIASSSGWQQCAWGQHGAHFPEGFIGPVSQF